MNTHELAIRLLDGPVREVTASIDLGGDDEERRAFGELYDLQYEADGETVTLLFECGSINYLDEE